MECGTKKEMNERKNPYKIVCFSLLFLISMTIGNAYSQKILENSVINLGLKLGLNALATTGYEVYMDEQLLENGSYKNKNGYLLNGFVRINLDRFFMQPEFEWNQYRQEANFALPVSGEENSYQSIQTLEINNNSFNVYVLTGYNIVKNGPYIVNIYMGASVKTIYKTNFNLLNDDEYIKRSFNYNYTGIFGMSLNVGIIHFDARYQFNFPNTDLNFDTIKDIPERYHGLSIRKNENILSFSCGIMF